MKNIYIFGSLAYDYIMDFPGYFKDHILPDKIHVLSISFLVNNIKKNFGGTAGNIAYSLALMNEKPFIISQAGNDFVDYSRWLKKNQISSQYIQKSKASPTASAHIVTDQADNQITAFHPGAMEQGLKRSLKSIVKHDSLLLISPGNLVDMIKLGKEAQKLLFPRFPTFCPGCPHRATFYALKRQSGGHAVFTQDIGCYSLGILPHFEIGDISLCMGASIGAACGLSYIIIYIELRC